MALLLLQQVACAAVGTPILATVVEVGVPASIRHLPPCRRVKGVGHRKRPKAVPSVIQAGGYYLVLAVRRSPNRMIKHLGWSPTKLSDTSLISSFNRKENSIKVEKHTQKSGAHEFWFQDEEVKEVGVMNSWQLFSPAPAERLSTEKAAVRGDSPGSCLIKWISALRRMTCCDE